MRKVQTRARNTSTATFAQMTVAAMKPGTSGQKNTALMTRTIVAEILSHSLKAAKHGRKKTRNPNVTFRAEIESVQKVAVSTYFSGKASSSL